MLLPELLTRDRLLCHLFGFLVGCRFSYQNFVYPCFVPVVAIVNHRPMRRGGGFCLLWGWGAVVALKVACGILTLGLSAHWRQALGCVALSVFKSLLKLC